MTCVSVTGFANCNAKLTSNSLLLDSPGTRVSCRSRDQDVSEGVVEGFHCLGSIRVLCCWVSIHQRPVLS